MTDLGSVERKTFLQNAPRVVVVIPTISTSLRTTVRASALAFRSAGCEVAVVCNTQSAAAGLQPSEYISFGSNLGFAGAISAVLAERDGRGKQWDWVLACNDDVLMDEILVRMALHSLAQCDPGIGCVLFDPEAPRRLPRASDVFSSLSLLGGHLHRALNEPLVDPTTLPYELAPQTYKSFSVVAISSSAWAALGGFDPAIPFCYEDADFIARLGGHGYSAWAYPLPFDHAHSVSTRSTLRDTLPVIAYSAVRYLQARSLRPVVARFWVSIAMIIRSLLACGSRSNRIQHVSGSVRGVFFAISGRVPQLVPFEDL